MYTRRRVSTRSPLGFVASSPCPPPFDRLLAVTRATEVSATRVTMILEMVNKSGRPSVVHGVVNNVDTPSRAGFAALSLQQPSLAPQAVLASWQHPPPSESQHRLPAPAVALSTGTWSAKHRCRRVGHHRTLKWSMKEWYNFGLNVHSASSWACNAARSWARCSSFCTDTHCTSRPHVTTPRSTYATGSRALAVTTRTHAHTHAPAFGFCRRLVGAS